MQSFHEIIFYILWTFTVAISAVGDYKLYREVANGEFKERLKDSSEDMGTTVDALNQAIGEKKTRLLNAVISSIPLIVVVILDFAMYYQGRYFESDMLNRATLTYLGVEILDSLFIAIKWPNPMFPERPISKDVMATTIFFSLANFVLLVTIIVVK